MVNNEDNNRLDHALEWCKKNKLKSDRLKLFNRGRKKRLVRGNLNKKETEKAKKRIQS